MNMELKETGLIKIIRIVFTQNNDVQSVTSNSCFVFHVHLMKTKNKRSDVKITLDLICFDKLVDCVSTRQGANLDIPNASECKFVGLHGD